MDAAAEGHRLSTGTARFTMGNGTLALPWDAERLATDGDHVALIACGHVFVWSPAQKDVVQAENVASLTQLCDSPEFYSPARLYDVAIAGDRVAWGYHQGNTGQQAELWVSSLSGRRTLVSLGKASGISGGAWVNPLGELAGSDALLVYSTWRDTCAPSSCARTREDRAVRSSCGGTRMSVSSAPLRARAIRALRRQRRPDRRRRGQRARPARLERNGTAVTPGARGGRITRRQRSCRIGTGDAPAPRRGNWSALAQLATAERLNWRTLCNTEPQSLPRPSARLEDSARGLVTYVIGKQVHLLRLDDGADVVVSPGQTSGFTDSGLVFADGPRLRRVSIRRALDPLEPSSDRLHAASDVRRRGRGGMIPFANHSPRLTGNPCKSRFDGGGGNRTRVRGRTEQSVYERSPCLISPAGRFTDDPPTGQPSFKRHASGDGTPFAPSPIVGAELRVSGPTRVDVARPSFD